VTRKLQFELAPPASRREARAGTANQRSINAVIARFRPMSVNEVAARSRAGSTSRRSRSPTGNLPEQIRHRAGAQAAGAIMVLLVIVSAVITP
jgi:hypothetical protein